MAINKSCLECNQGFKTYPSQDYSFCSHLCSNRFNARKYPVWNKGKKLPPRSLEVRLKMSERNRGKKNPFFGKKHSVLFFKKAIGRKLSAEHRESLRRAAKMRKFNAIGNLGEYATGKIWVGKNNPNWKGGVTPEDKKQRLRFRQTMQKLIFERDNYTCRLCGATNTGLQVDHINSWALFIEQRFLPQNCRTLCTSCHYQITFGKPMPPNTKNWGYNLPYGS